MLWNFVSEIQNRKKYIYSNLFIYFHIINYIIRTKDLTTFSFFFVLGCHCHFPIICMAKFKNSSSNFSFEIILGFIMETLLTNIGAILTCVSMYVHVYECSV